MHEEPVEGLGQVGRPIPRGQGRVLSLQEGRLILDCVPDVLSVLQAGAKYMVIRDRGLIDRLNNSKNPSVRTYIAVIEKRIANMSLDYS
jgi:hypothetical protein